MKKCTYFLIIIYSCLFFSCRKDDVTDSNILIQTWYQDADQDGFGNKDKIIKTTAQPKGYVANADDCDDTNANVNPSAVEINGDNIDNNCDGQIAECTSDTDCQGVCIFGFCNKTNLHEKFSKKYFSHALTGKEVPYNYFIPKNDDNKKLPLVVSLHGAEYFSNPEDKFLLYPSVAYMTLAWIEDTNQTQYPCYVLAPNIHRELLPVYSDFWDGNKGTDLVKQLLTHFVQNHANIDTSRIYLTGHSIGGIGAWYIGAKLKNIFAAIVSLSSAGLGTRNFIVNEVKNGGFKNLPIWDFIQIDDGSKGNRKIFTVLNNKGYQPVYTHTFGGEQYNLTREQIAQEINNGKQYFYTEYSPNSGGHYIMHRALRTPLLFKWLFNQKKK